MKFSVLKTLTTPGHLTSDWKKSINRSYEEKPDAVRQDYEKLVRAIADLQLMEEYLRKEVLHNDESTSYLRQTVELAMRMGMFIAPILATFSPGTAGKLAAILAALQGLSQNERDRELLRSF